MPRLMSLPRPALAGRSLLLTALAVELVDELVDGTRGAALPLIRHSFSLTYPQIGLLASAPLVLGSLLEMPTGILAGRGRGRRLTVLAGGLVFTAALAATAAARSFWWLLAAFVLFFPASGAFVSLTQAGLMDADPGRRDQHLARWTLAGSAGAVAGPLLLTGVLAAGGGWRAAYLVLTAGAASAWLAVARAGRGRPGARTGQVASLPAGAGTAGTGDGAHHGEAGAGRHSAGEDAEGAGLAAGGMAGRLARAREAIGLLRSGEALRWLALLQVADLLLDVLTGFLALYLVDVAHASPAQAALGVAVRLGAGLAGDALLVHLLERASPLLVLRAGTLVAAVLYPAFLLVPGLAAKLVILAALSVATASWYPVMQARWYGSLPGHSDVAVSLESAAALAGGLGPAAVGGLASLTGLGWALGTLAAVPVVILAALARPARRRHPAPGGVSGTG